jgi:hypothetical protein
MLTDSVDYLMVISPICAPFQWNPNCTKEVRALAHLWFLPAPLITERIRNPRPWCPPFGNREGWGSLSLGWCQQFKGGPAPGQQLRYRRSFFFIVDFGDGDDALGV